MSMLPESLPKTVLNHDLSGLNLDGMKKAEYLSQRQLQGILQIGLTFWWKYSEGFSKPIEQYTSEEIADIVNFNKKEDYTIDLLVFESLIGVVAERSSNFSLSLIIAELATIIAIYESPARAEALCNDLIHKDIDFQFLTAFLKSSRRQKIEQESLDSLKTMVYRATREQLLSKIGVTQNQMKDFEELPDSWILKLVKDYTDNAYSF